MKSYAKKIEKLLEKSEDIASGCFDTPRKNGEKEIRKREKKADRAQALAKKALALCREDIGKGRADAAQHLIRCIHQLSAILFRRGRQEEAEPLLAEIFADRNTYRSSTKLSACLAYYGSILCESRRYNEAATVLDMLLTRLKTAAAVGITPDDTYAVSRGLGNAARAFTYSDTGEGFAPENFTYPIDTLKKLMEKGMEVDGNHIKKAAYFAAGQQLFLTCYDTVPGADVSRVVNYATECLNVCRDSGVKDLWYLGVYRLLALAMARNCRFSDCADLCAEALDECGKYKDATVRDDFGSVQGFAGDLNLLLGILNYRASGISDCIRYFEAAIAAFEADAQSRPLREMGYVEAETDLIFMTHAEKCAFACKYIGLAKFSERERYSLDECLQVMRRGVQLLETVDPDEPYFLLAASADYHIMSQMCERAGDKEAADKWEGLSKDRGMSALSVLHDSLSDGGRFQQYAARMRVHRRIAMRLGLLELYGDYTRFEILLCEPPYSEVNHPQTARLNFEMGEYCRVVGKNQSAVEYYSEVRNHTFDRNGKPYYEMGEGNIFEFSLIASASCLVKNGEMAKARRLFREYADTRMGSDVNDNQKTLIKIAGLSREIGLDPLECAGYMHKAASALESGNGDLTVAADLYNQEGICWYNVSPSDDPEGMEKLSQQEKKQFVERIARSELQAFENAIRVLDRCDSTNEKVMDLKPSLHSNVGECYMRIEGNNSALDTALQHYYKAVDAFEKLFATDYFNAKSAKDQEPYVFQYGMCFKALGDIYNLKQDNPKCAEALSKAIDVMERLDNPAAQNELAACLNARGVVHFRLGDFQKNVEDATRAINLKKDDNGGEINMAIMLKNRSDAYCELGDYKSMQSDLTRSIDMLGKSELPDEMLNSFYGSNWFSMGVCQEGLHKIGKAADAYRKAAGYMDKGGNSEDSGAYMKVMCHFRRAICLCRREEQEYYDALYEYNNAIRLLEEMPASPKTSEQLSQLLSSRGSLYEAFREIDLAKADFSRAESLRSHAELQGE